MHIARAVRVFDKEAKHIHAMKIYMFNGKFHAYSINITDCGYNGHKATSLLIIWSFYHKILNKFLIGCHLCQNLHNPGMKNINWLGMWTLYKKETLRFIKVYNQTLVAPVITALLFLSIFTLAIGGRVSEIGGVPFAEFIAVGLVMMTIVQNAFANTSSSLIMGKVLGTVIDYLIPPLSSSEIVFAMTMAGITRGFAIGVMTVLVILPFVDLGVHDVGLVLFYVLAASMMMALIGIVGGIFAESFDQMAAITSYIITPLSFLSGTFYSVKRLPEFWQVLNQFNPFFYMIDGFRYAMTGYSDAPIHTGMVVLIAMNVVCYVVAWYLLKTGKRIKT